MHAMVSLHPATAFALLLLLLLADFIAPTIAARDAVCWTQKTPTSEKPIPTVFKACHDAIKIMFPDPKSGQKPILFSRKENHGYQVPKQWRRGNCVVRIDMHDDDAEDTLTFLDLATAAGKVNIVCVARPPHFGGSVAVGANQVMNVSVFGWPLQKSFLNLGLDISTAKE
ncbi:MAG: hypothetical protein L6R38_007594 [Xanthoria sp. 2 TBL-2021]|nr:MAG: hypothetical protein L6R38_007594 [Xanthoria sp. 2 TBL-2021]